MPSRLDGKRVVVFGGATGIGFETVKLLIEEGALVTVGDLNVEAGAKLSDMFQDSICFQKCDVSSEDDVRALYAQAGEFGGQVDAMVNCAGMQISGEADALALDDWNRIMAVNAGGAFLTAKHAIPYMRKAGKGSIVIIASTAGLRGGPEMTAYSASKGAMVAFGRALAMELGKNKIRVNVVCPGWTDTAFNGPVIETLGGVDARDSMLKVSVPLQRQAHPREIAQVNVHLASDESSYVTGQSIVVDGGLI
ncbi:hypothetical protein B6V72_17210 [Thioclava sp. F34-6]|uniref:SDR family NAD(P)-dependent oxidoreductase n=1 Tax=Thioclava sp. F34-6 TaxID=1973003 RepID=UPI000B53A9DC|nr:SDR family NAD(P)-dependent oxidoreductase [Thioclava sp. F34-6]OWY10354.1 hypothetical protein B6V72_17210 [Thioclava sp. F34-6]